MANTQMNTPAICPVSSPSNKPALGENVNGLSIRGLSLPKRDAGSNPAEVVINSVPDVGPHVEMDHGPMHGEEFWEKEHK